jgi:fucose permease
MIVAFQVPIFLALLLIEVADAMCPLSDAVRTKFLLRSFMATLMPFFVFIAFAIFSVPGGVLAARIGKRNVLLLGLGLTALAMDVPAPMNPAPHRRSLF